MGTGKLLGKPNKLRANGLRWTSIPSRGSRNTPTSDVGKEYIGITEPLTRILKSHDIRVTNKPIKTLQQEFPVPKFGPRVDNQWNVVYKIPCGSCPWSYIGKTKRLFSTRRKEHIRNTKQCTKGSNAAKHAWTLDHTIDFKNAEIIDKGNNWIRKTLESWHTAKTAKADNNSCPLPGQYNILLNQR